MSHLEIEEELKHFFIIVEFYSLNELIIKNPDFIFDTDGDLYKDKESLINYSLNYSLNYYDLNINKDDYPLAPNELHYLGKTIQLSLLELDLIPKWCIKRNLGQ